MDDPIHTLPGRLGKLPARRDRRTLQLSTYMRNLPPAPAEVDYLSAITDWGMMGNDVLGDCTCAALGHAVQVWSAATGSILTPPDAAVVDLYSRSCGYDPADPDATDRGGFELDVLNYVRQQGSTGLLGQQLLAYADPEPQNVGHVRQAIHLFGGVYIGLSLPESAQAPGDWTDVSGIPGSWGGHAVFVPKYDRDGLTCITWGRLQFMSWGFWEAYCDETHALLGSMWLDRASADFHLGDLQADLALVTR